MGYAETYENTTSSLMESVNNAIATATECCSTAKGMSGETRSALRNEYYQRAHQALLNGVIASNVAVITELKHLRALLREQHAEAGIVGKDTAEGDPA